MPSDNSRQTDIRTMCRTMAERARAAAARLAQVPGRAVDRWLADSAARLRAEMPVLLEANARDLAAAAEYGLSAAQVDRLALDPDRIGGMAAALDEIARLPHPVGEILESRMRPNGLEVRKVRVPLGVVFFIYESRPNVTSDAAAICLKSRNAVILRGGKESLHSNLAIVKLLAAAAEANGLPADALACVATPDREAVGHFLAMDELIDVAIPRGGEGLIRRVAAEARMPVIKHFDGNCHVYVDRTADPHMALDIVVNSKCQRLGVCNACESLVVHGELAPAWLPAAGAALKEHGIEIRGDDATCRLVPGSTPATDEDYGREYLGPIVSVKVVATLDEAIEHINRYGSHHTDAIVTSDLESARRFAGEVDSAAVMINASTRFNDGGELGLGAEIGISTDKFHARGPCGLAELTSYKYVVTGTGQVRE